MTSRVYFIRAGENGPIKIGFSTCIKDRMKELQVGCAEKLILLAHCPGGEELERFFHHQYSEHRKLGEWFDPDPAILVAADHIKRCHDQALPGDKDKERDARQARFMGETFTLFLKIGYGQEPGWAMHAARDAGVSDEAVRAWIRRAGIPHLAPTINLARANPAISHWFYNAAVACWIADELGVDENDAFVACLQSQTLVKRAWSTDGQEHMADIFKQIMDRKID